MNKKTIFLEIILFSLIQITCAVTSQELESMRSTLMEAEKIFAYADKQTNILHVENANVFLKNITVNTLWVGGAQESFSVCDNLIVKQNALFEYPTLIQNATIHSLRSLAGFIFLENSTVNSVTFFQHYSTKKEREYVIELHNSSIMEIITCKNASGVIVLRGNSTVNGHDKNMQVIAYDSLTT